MKAITYRLSAYTLASFLGLSFYFTIFYMFKLYPVLGLAIVSCIILMAAFLFLEKDAVQFEEIRK